MSPVLNIISSLCMVAGGLSALWGGLATIMLWSPAFSSSDPHGIGGALFYFLGAAPLVIGVAVFVFGTWIGRQVPPPGKKSQDSG